jgi:hypothetical protein
VARFEALGWLRDKGRDRLVLNEEVVLKIAEESARYELKRGDGNQVRRSSYMGRITLSGNRFEESDLGIAISRPREVILKGNVFENVATPYAVKPGDQTKVIEK